jgi:hypothetical protein
MVRRMFAAFAVFAAASSLRASCPAPKFEAPPSYDGGPTPVPVAVANINGDPWLDLVVGNSDGNDDRGGVAVLLGEPNAKFSKPVRYEFDASVYSIAVADFDNDGDDDVLAFDTAFNHSEFAVIVLRNDRGVLVRAARLVIDDFYSRVLTGDFNGDGRADFIVADTSDSVTLFLGGGDFTFTKSEVPAGAALNGSAVVEDFDRDGKSDVALVRQGGSAVIALFGASGGFRPAITWTLGVPDTPYFRSIIAGDFNGDRKLDLLAGFDFRTAGLILDAGAGSNATITAIQSLPDNESMGPMVAADLDGDGTDDLAASWIGGVSVFRSSNAVFRETARNMIMGGEAAGIVAADFDRDGDADLVVASYNLINVLVNDSGHLRSPAYTVYPSAVADFNHDGRDDVLNGTVAWLAKPDGTFAPASLGPRDGPTEGPTIGEPFPATLSAAVGDLNNDGNPDFVYLGRAPNYTYALQRTIGLGNGNGLFLITVELLSPYEYESPPQLADVDGDGRLDLIAIVFKNVYPDSSWPVIIARGNGDGTFGPAIERDFGQVFGEVRIGDFNGDHKPDLFVISSVGTVVLNDGHGNFPSPIESTVFLADGFGIGDLNGDGFDDVAAVSAVHEYSTVFLFFSRGDGTFVPQQELSTVVSGVGKVVIQDLNGDGNKDIFVVEFPDSSGRFGSAPFLAGDGKGHFAGSVSIPTTSHGEIFTGDFNGDGITDLEDSGYVRLGTCTSMPERRHAVR